MSLTVLLLPGDGIGPEVVREARRVLDWANARYALDLSFVEANLGGVAIDRDGAAYPDATRKLARVADGILLGAVGGQSGTGCQRLIDQNADCSRFALIWICFVICGQPCCFLIWRRHRVCALSWYQALMY